MGVDFNNCEMHRYKVPIIGGIQNYYEVLAPNKTVARRIADGETHPWIHCEGKIIDCGVVAKIVNGEVVEYGGKISERSHE